MHARTAALCVLLAMAPLSGCLGTATNERCVDNATSSNGQAVIQADGARFQYSDPQGLVNSNWQGRAKYVITVDNAVITQTLKAFTRTGSCSILG